MRTIFLLLLLITGSYLHAGTNIVTHTVRSCVFRTDSAAQRAAEVQRLQDLLHGYRAEKAAGVGLFTGGAALFVIGEALMITSLARAINGTNPYHSSNDDPMWRAGLASTLVGVGGLASGVPLYVIGNKRSRSIVRRINRLRMDQPEVIIQ